MQVHIIMIMVTIVIGMMTVSVMYVLGMLHVLMNVIDYIGCINVKLHAMDP